MSGEKDAVNMKFSVKTALAGACACALVGTGVVAAAPAMAVQRLTTRTPSSSSVSTPLLCGDVITTDTVLHKDLIDCPDNGLVIGADGVTVDLNGHSISGDNSLNEQCGGDQYATLASSTVAVTEASRSRMALFAILR